MTTRTKIILALVGVGVVLLIMKRRAQAAAGGSVTRLVTGQRTAIAGGTIRYFNPLSTDMII